MCFTRDRNPTQMQEEKTFRGTTPHPKAHLELNISIASTDNKHIQLSVELPPCSAGPPLHLWGQLPEYLVFLVVQMGNLAHPGGNFTITCSLTKCLGPKMYKWNETSSRKHWNHGNKKNANRPFDLKHCKNKCAKLSACKYNWLGSRCVSLQLLPCVPGHVSYRLCLFTTNLFCQICFARNCCWIRSMAMFLQVKEVAFFCTAGRLKTRRSGLMFVLYKEI